MLSDSEFTATVVEKAKSLGASVAGVADVGTLKESPSHLIYPKIGMHSEVPWQDAPEEALHHEVEWPADAVSAVVIGVEHPVDRPELDWYDGKGTPGNRILIRITKELSAWLEETFSVKSYRPPYFIESTGIFLKDSAVLAGLGCIGKNNLVITPEYGPRIRWRALLLDRTCKATGPVDYVDRPLVDLARGDQEGTATWRTSRWLGSRRRPTRSTAASRCSPASWAMTRLSVRRGSVVSRNT
jgi:epoxyqueuosine reductase